MDAAECDHRYVPIGRNWRGRTVYACKDCGDRYAAKTVEELAGTPSEDTE